MRAEPRGMCSPPAAARSTRAVAMAVSSRRLSLEPTAGSVWFGAAVDRITDELLEWPPDLLALTELILTRSEAYRFALSPRKARRGLQSSRRHGLTRSR